MVSERDLLRIEARTSSTVAVPCPDCGAPSSRRHSGYVRRLDDAAVGGRRACIQLMIRRLFCDNTGCERVTFAEQVQGLTVRYGRRTPLQESECPASVVGLDRRRVVPGVAGPLPHTHPEAVNQLTAAPTLTMITGRGHCRPRSAFPSAGSALLDLASQLRVHDSLSVLHRQVQPARRQVIVHTTISMGGSASSHPDGPYRPSRRGNRQRCPECELPARPRRGKRCPVVCARCTGPRTTAPVTHQQAERIASRMSAELSFFLPTLALGVGESLVAYRQPENSASRPSSAGFSHTASPDQSCSRCSLSPKPCRPSVPSVPVPLERSASSWSIPASASCPRTSPPLPAGTSPG
ncbi:transposase family protein [Streptantibioticus ferralitis]|uniref:Transposase family protein n=2 Tax=Streptantibioticus ferralitis TaxID=236510 RepID=A0ABT5Z4T5_9ACTN|nr:transposase family protein [Streptantibioticus ferralitis]